MAIESDSSTRHSLLAALTSSNHDAVWSVFVEKYGQLLFYWCSRWGASPEDSEDLVQEVLLNVFKSINSFQIQADGTFRAWLRTIAWRCWSVIHEKQQRSLNGNRPLLQSLVFQNPDREAQARLELVSDFDRIAQTEILELAFSIVRARVEPLTWEIFERTEIYNENTDFLTRELQVSIGTVYAAKCRVRRMIHQEVLLIDPPSHFKTNT
jgi:RNA polymerase sigma-70 factor (ECF subfamily)